MLPDERASLARLDRIAADLERRYGYPRMEAPLFEQSEVFERGVGEVTDVVEKELFRLAAGGEGGEGERWALRPEATAGVVRAYIQHGMHALPQPVRLSLLGPMFRYDRPQAGRYRQFWQWDVEAIGDAGPAIDAEIVELAMRFYREAGVPGVRAHLNSIGDAACRPAYVERLVAHFRRDEDRLPPLERSRLERNPLRLLDSKDPAMAELVASAPRIVDALCDACRLHFEALIVALETLGVPFSIEPTLVRGLDYYTRTVFEFYLEGQYGQQDAVGSGGRYDGLVELLGGRPTPAIGFALGLDRVMLVLDERDASPRERARPAVVVVGAEPDSTTERLAVATELRAAGLFARADLARRKLGRQLEAAAREGAHFAVILGEELRSGQIQLKDLEAGTQRAVNRAELVRELLRAEASHRHG